MKRSIVILSFFNFIFAMNIAAQELNAKVTINHSQIQGTDVSVFETLQLSLEQFINERQWTDYQFQSTSASPVTSTSLSSITTRMPIVLRQRP